MTTLDMLARSSAKAIHQSVSFVPVPVGGIARTSRVLVLKRSMSYALAGAAAAVIAVIAMLVVATPADEVTDVTNTTALTPTTMAEPSVETTLPAELPDGLVPVVPPEVIGETAPGDVTPPQITIVSPDDGTHTTRSSISVTGFVEDGARVSGPTDGPVDVGSDGVWQANVQLDIGENRVVFTAIDNAGNFATAAIIVHRDAPPTTTTTKPSDTTTTTTEAPSWEFTAHKTYGTCSDTPPYDIYYGTGKPGTEISVTSEYGGGGTVIAENGEWSVKVFFAEAPANEGFIVKVYHFDGAKKTFEFTYTPE